VPGDRGGNVSTMGALGWDGTRTGLRVPGAIDGETRLFLVEELSVPTLQRGDIVVLENTPIHKRADSEDASEAAGAGVLVFPPSSPDLNPSENCRAKVKTRWRALKPRSLPDLLEALGEAFSSITRQALLGGVRHYGYESHSIENCYKGGAGKLVSTYHVPLDGS
jgi:transposase